jgi:hypothetical protein
MTEDSGEMTEDSGEMTEDSGGIDGIMGSGI